MDQTKPFYRRFDISLSPIDYCSTPPRESGNRPSLTYVTPVFQQHLERATTGKVSLLADESLSGLALSCHGEIFDDRESAE